ncbi:hypothetical protein [Sigmofec virus UA08Rod_5342]|uniref:Uncharacterized protein n=1 Tax=Sigmofec virus UA08Rod_5342 TaxID=2929420 RepID=A0A976R700_9VIRU|nr:hypothetical protein [Sigmofec virus UA08Rod_5342]
MLYLTIQFSGARSGSFLRTFRRLYSSSLSVEDYLGYAALTVCFRSSDDSVSLCLGPGESCVFEGEFFHFVLYPASDTRIEFSVPRHSGRIVNVRHSW